jgi:hypothetical protein
LASFLTSLVMWRKCSLKSNMRLMWTPSILYDLFDWWEVFDVGTVCKCDRVNLFM